MFDLDDQELEVIRLRCVDALQATLAFITSNQPGFQREMDEALLRERNSEMEANDSTEDAQAATSSSSTKRTASPISGRAKDCLTTNPGFGQGKRHSPKKPRR